MFGVVANMFTPRAIGQFRLRDTGSGKKATGKKSVADGYGYLVIGNNLKQILYLL
jgi:hypothetical protein